MSLWNYGYEMLDGFSCVADIDEIKSELESSTHHIKRGGIRNAEKKFKAISVLVSSLKLKQSAEKYLSGEPKLVRVILFDKAAGNNWLVTWHQDKTIAVCERSDIAGWGPWTIKDGIHHVQPAIEVLNQMVTFRIHLDDSTLENGCLKLMPNSHKNGIMSHEEIQHYVTHHEPFVCEANIGSALVMRPHILHASSKAKVPSRRRILHVEFSSYELPNGVLWA